MTPRAFVRLTEPAIDDLRRLHRVDPQIVRWAFKKMLLLEQNPMAGEPLLGSLVGYRKLAVGDRDWRIVWRVTVDGSGQTLIDIAEVWAVGARADREVYLEMRERIDRHTSGHVAQPLAEVVEMLGRMTWGIEAASEPAPEPLPHWLVDKLTHVAGIDPLDIQGMNLEQAFEAWTNWIQRSR